MTGNVTKPTDGDTGGFIAEVENKRRQADSGHVNNKDRKKRNLQLAVYAMNFHVSITNQGATV